MTKMTNEKTIVYLDQNFASNAAKAECLPCWKDPNKGYYEELLAVLKSQIRLTDWHARPLLFTAKSRNEAHV